MKAELSALFSILTFCAVHSFVTEYKYSDQDSEVVLVRHIEGNGYHRLLNFSAVVGGNDMTEFQNACSLVIHQVLPTSLYVDTEQLNQLSKSCQVSNEYFVDGSTDVEGSAETSNLTSVFILCNKLNDNDDEAKDIISVKTHCAISSVGSDLIHYSFLLPIHVRYHAPRSTGGYRSIEIPPPLLLINCSSLDGMLAPSLHKDIVPPTTLFKGWKSIAYKDMEPLENSTRDEQDNLSMMVPVGDLDHLVSVQIVTLLLINSAAVYLLSFLFSSTSNLQM